MSFNKIDDCVAKKRLIGKDRYEIMNVFLGEGTYGKVEKARDLVTGNIVAIKKVKVDVKNLGRSGEQKNEFIGSIGIHFTTIREIKIMKEINHPNIMGILDAFVEGDYMNLVMNYMVSDLKKLLQQKFYLNESHIKCIMQQILMGVEELHSWYFIHRDLSPANIFINELGICKVADFGLSRMYGYSMKDKIYTTKSNKKAVWKENFTEKVITLWYRPAELIFGANKYGPAVDMWSVGCIFAELLSRGEPLFPGVNEIDQLSKILAIMGTPSDTNWPGARNLPSYCEFTFCNKKPLSDVLPKECSDTSISLLEELLKLEPSSRISAQDALKHEYFSMLPLPCSPEELPLQYAIGA